MNISLGDDYAHILPKSGYYGQVASADLNYDPQTECFILIIYDRRNPDKNMSKMTHISHILDGLTKRKEDKFHRMLIYWEAMYK